MGHTGQHPFAINLDQNRPSTVTTGDHALQWQCPRTAIEYITQPGAMSVSNPVLCPSQRTAVRGIGRCSGLIGPRRPFAENLRNLADFRGASIEWHRPDV